jgi:hypothetical protein
LFFSSSFSFGVQMHMAAAISGRSLSSIRIRVLPWWGPSLLS